MTYLNDRSPEDLPHPRRVYSGLIKPYSVLDRMWDDDISILNVAEHLRDWASNEPCVKRITLGYGAGYYSIIVLLDPLLFEVMQRTVRQLSNTKELFNGRNFLAYPLGPQQSDSTLFNSIENYDIISEMKGPP